MLMYFFCGVLATVVIQIAFVKFNEPDSDKLKIKETIFAEKKGKLVDLLTKACNELLNQEWDISLFSSYKSYQEFARHIMAQVAPLQQYVVDQSPDSMQRIKAALQELHEIFLPTSDWDDAGGSSAIANEILALLKEMMF
nr:hypothetical protein [Candidatus Sigynarchaeota archaeon]